MRQIAYYGKGGIGKSAIVANVAAAMAEAGNQVMQIGCDPKRDSTRMLLGGQFSPPVLEKLRSDSPSLTAASLVTVGFNGVRCIEAGGSELGRERIRSADESRGKRQFSVYIHGCRYSREH